MKIEFEFAGFETENRRMEFAAKAQKANIKLTLNKHKYYDTMILEGDDQDLEKFVEDHWQVTDDDQTYDELLANGDIAVTVLD